LVVILIILLVSAAALPVVIPAVSHRQVSESARILQGALAGAHDTAIHNGAPAGIRLLPDPLINGINQDPTSQNYGLLDKSLPLAANRIIPIEPAADYGEGSVSIVLDQKTGNSYPFAGAFPYPNLVTGNITNAVLMVEECPIDTSTGLPNEPTNWFWNIRIGEKIQIGSSSQLYTVVGPLPPKNIANPDQFVGDGLPGTPSQLQRVYLNPMGQPLPQLNVEYLFLVNGEDDAPKDGFVDNLWNTPSNDGDAFTNQTIEYENETWLGSLASLTPPFNANFQISAGPSVNLPYTITRRPVPSARGREIQLPSNVVIDLTTWGNTTLERSRLPLQAFNQSTGSIDILVYPNGQVVPTMNYSTPASVGLAGAFFHFWLAERTDVTAPISLTVAPALPIGNIAQQLLQGAPYPGPKLKGEYRLVTVFARNGQISTNDNALFDNPLAPQNGQAYNANFPYLQAIEGIAGGQ